MPNPASSFRPEPRSIPQAPGCYQFKDGDGRIIYVGKAKSLRARVSSYFQATSGLAPRTIAMLQSARSVEWIVVESEVDALHLEYTLIQRHRPRYNVQYRDDKSYPYLVLSTSQPVPRARVQRSRIAAGDRKFGPYAHAYAIRETLDLLIRVFPVRTCADGVYERAARNGQACLLYHIERCSGPCIGAINHTDHRALVDSLASFLAGDTTAVLSRLDQEMREAATELRFEVAARRRDQLEAARRALEQQQVVSQSNDDMDVVGLYDDDLDAAIQVFFVRHGRLVGRKGWIVDKVEDLSPSALLTSFLLQLYGERSDDIPPLVVVPFEPDERGDLETLLTEQRQREFGRATKHARCHVPQRGDKRRLLATVTTNAQDSFERSRLKRANDFDSRSRALTELQQALGLDEPLLRIECYDISHLAGTEVVGSMVVFEDGLPKKSDYRRFKLTVDANDDVAAMREVIERRFTRLVKDRAAPLDVQRKSFAYPPSLVIIDGGVGQLRAARAAIENLPIDDIPFVGLAKRFEQLWIEGKSKPVELPRGSDALYLVQRVRDEAHRFAVTHQRQRRNRAITTALDEVPGIGPRRRAALLRTFGSITNLKRASTEEISAVDGISPTLAAVLHQHLHDDTRGT